MEKTRDHWGKSSCRELGTGEENGAEKGRDMEPAFCTGVQWGGINYLHRIIES